MWCRILGGAPPTLNEQHQNTNSVSPAIRYATLGMQDGPWIPTCLPRTTRFWNR